MTPLDMAPRARRPRVLRLLRVEAPIAANPSPNAAALTELLSRIGLRAARVDVGLVADPALRRSLVAMAAKGADYVVVVGDPGDLDALRADLGPVEIRVHAVDLSLADREVTRLAAEGIWPIGHMILDGSPLAA